MRSVLTIALASVVCAAAAQPCSAQGGGFGLGARMSLVRGDVRADTNAARFFGGQMRLRTSTRTAIEVSLDSRSHRNEQLTQRIKDRPLQASLLVFPLRSVFSPYVLGGGGWYSHTVETLVAEEVVNSETERKFGWHAGFGAELRLGAHAGVHADYRYTFLHFGGTDAIESDTIAGAIASAHTRNASGSRFLPTYDGSMWTMGITVYF
jgi:opacity protein-like surface antigen